MKASLGLAFLLLISSQSADAAYVFLAGTLSSPDHDSVVNYVQLACHQTLCTVNIFLPPSGDEQRSIKISPNHCHKEKLHYLKTPAASVAVTRLTSDHAVTLSYETWDNSHSTFYDKFILYPVLSSDKLFILTLSSKTKIAMILPHTNGTKVEITTKDSRENIVKMKRVVLEFSGLLLKDELVTNGALVESDHPIAVHVGEVTVQAHVRPLHSHGTRFLSTGSDKVTKYLLSFFSHPEAAVVKTRKSERDKSGTMMSTLRVPNLTDTDFKGHKIEMEFESIDISSDEPIAVALTFDSPDNDMSLLALLVAEEAWMSSYIVCPPQQTSVISMVSFIAKRDDLPKIEVNGKVASTLNSSWKPVAGSTNHSWTRIKCDRKMTFSVGTKKLVRFGLYLCASSNKGSYFTEAGINSTYKYEPNDYGHVAANVSLDSTTSECACFCDEEKVRLFDGMPFDTLNPLYFWIVAGFALLELIIIVALTICIIRSVNSKRAAVAPAPEEGTKPEETTQETTVQETNVDETAQQGDNAQESTVQNDAANEASG